MLVAEGPLAADTGRAVDVGGNLATLGAAEGATLLATRSGIFTLALMTRSSWSSQAQPSAPVSKATTTPAVREKLGQQGIDPMPITAAEFDALIRKEIAESIALVKAAGIKVN